LQVSSTHLQILKLSGIPSPLANMLFGCTQTKGNVESGDPGAVGLAVGESREEATSCGDTANVIWFTEVEAVNDG